MFGIDRAAIRKASRMKFGPAMLRGTASVIAAIVFWEFASRWQLPLFQAVPTPTAVLSAISKVFLDMAFWKNWSSSFQRVVLGFVMAQIVGIPLGLSLAMNRHFYGTMFPILEILRPIPPLAWVPASIIFWPTTELSIAFVIFLGAFFTVVINVVGGAQSIDSRFFQSAQAMGASPYEVVTRINPLIHKIVT